MEQAASINNGAYDRDPQVWRWMRDCNAPSNGTSKIDRAVTAWYLLAAIHIS
jgi:hypothetical protein